MEILAYVILFGVFGFFLFLFYHWYHFRNPYKLYMVFGKKGSGKTTLITKMAIKYLRKGRTVYSTVPVPGTYGFDPKKIGQLQFEPNSVIFVDEVGMIFDNRDYKSFKGDTRDWFKLQRHYGCTVYLFSQAFDIDKKLRDLTDHMYLITNWFNCISVARKINRYIAIVHSDAGTGESHLADDMDFTPWFTIPFGGAIFTWIPAWVKYFDSFDAPVLPLQDFVYYNPREDLYHVTLLSRYLSRFKRAVRKLSAASEAGEAASLSPALEDGQALSQNAAGDDVPAFTAGHVDGKTTDKIGSAEDVA